MSLVKKIVEVDAGDIRRFNQLHPQQGAWTWFVRTALKNYVQLFAIDPAEVVELAVREIKIKDPEGA